MSIIYSSTSNMNRYIVSDVKSKGGKQDTLYLPKGVMQCCDVVTIEKNCYYKSMIPPPPRIRIYGTNVLQLPTPYADMMAR